MFRNTQETTRIRVHIIIIPKGNAARCAGHGPVLTGEEQGRISLPSSKVLCL